MYSTAPEERPERDMAHSNGALNEQARRVGNPGRVVAPPGLRHGRPTFIRRFPLGSGQPTTATLGRRRTGRGVTGARQHAHPEMHFYGSPERNRSGVSKT